MELVLIVFCIGLLILGIREEVLKNKKVVNKIEEENKYEKGTGLRFEAITEDDDIQDFSMNKEEEEEEEEVELVDYLLDGLYGKVEGENLFGFTSVRKIVPQMNIQLLSQPKKEIHCELEGCPPMILRHFFGRDYVEPLVV